MWISGLFIGVLKQHFGRIYSYTAALLAVALCRLKGIGRNVLSLDGFRRLYDDFDIRQSRRYSADVGADRSVGAGYRLAGFRVFSRVKKNPLDNLPGTL